jgi:hypothetical protein
MVTGYLSGCVEDPRAPSEPNGIHPLFAIPKFYEKHSAGAGRSIVEEVPFSTLLTKDIPVGVSDGGNLTLRPPGVSRDMFRDYIFLLTDGMEDGEMNALVLAPGLGFSRMVRNVRDLASLLGDYRPDWAPAPNPAPSREPRSSRFKA